MVIGGEIKIARLMYRSLSYDHRIVDGKGGGDFPCPGERGAGVPASVADGSLIRGGRAEARPTASRAL